MSKEGDSHLSVSDLQLEVVELRARLSECQLVQSENAQLRGENERLRTQLSEATAVAVMLLTLVALPSAAAARSAPCSLANNQRKSSRAC